jgi:hypothetical protein
MIAFKQFVVVLEKNGATIDMHDGVAPLKLSGPQGTAPDPITGEIPIAKVPHYSFSLPAGYSCPFAEECRSRTISNGKEFRNKDDELMGMKGNVEDGPLCAFRCFAVSGEEQYPSVRAMRNGNFEVLTGINIDNSFADAKTREKYGINKGNHSKKNAPIDQLDKLMKDPEEAKLGDAIGGISHHIHDTKLITDLIVKTIAIHKDDIMNTGPKYNGGGVLRVHVSGDFYAQSYFDGWMLAAVQFPDITFYSYTKSLPYWIKARDEGTIPENYKLVASYGGSQDKFKVIEKEGFKFAKVCFSREEAENFQFTYVDKDGKWRHAQGLDVCEEDDYPAYGSDRPFALLLHGNQPSLDADGKPTKASISIRAINKSADEEKFQSRVDYLVSQGHTDLDARIEIVTRIYAAANERDLSWHNGFVAVPQTRNTDKSVDFEARKESVIRTICRFIYRDEQVKRGEMPSAKLEWKDVEQFETLAKEKFDAIIERVESMEWKITKSSITKAEKVNIAAAKAEAKAKGEKYKKPVFDTQEADSDQNDISMKDFNYYLGQFEDEVEKEDVMKLKKISKKAPIKVTPHGNIVASGRADEPKVEVA